MRSRFDVLPRSSSRRRGLVLWSAAFFLVALVVPVTAASAEPRPAERRAAVLDRQPIHDGIFRSTCLPSHVAMDDPIVHPGEPGASHQHEFFGNVTTNADSTYATLRAGATTCRIAADTAGYWVPSLFADGQRVAPLRVNAYYLLGRGREAIAAFPAGLKIVAGNGSATTPQSLTVTGWRCSGVDATPLTADPAACPAGSHNVLIIRFPDCWNGKDLDSSDHHSHMAYRVAGACPAGYPVRVPRLALHVQYDLPSVTGLTLASGSIYSAHADFFNAWKQAALVGLVRLNLR